MRILFFGTPEISTPFLEKLLKTADVVGVVTQPDRPSDRGQKLHEPPVKTLALANKIPVFQPEKFTPEIMESLKNLKADAGIAVSYGKLIPEAVFNAPVHGSFNVHFSLLPKYRGAAPVQLAIVKGETKTGVTTFRLEKTLDTGPIFVQKRIPITDEDDAGTMFAKLIPLGVEAANETLELFKAGKTSGTPQTGEPSYAHCIKKEDGKIFWDKTAREIFNLVRGFKDWPGACAVIAGGALKDKKIKIIKADILPQAGSAQNPGTIIEIIKNKGFTVQCGLGLLLVETVHPENKKPMPAWQFIQGSRLNTGDLLK